MWLEGAAALPGDAGDLRAELWFEAAANHVRAAFAQAREIFERFPGGGDRVRLEAAMGLEEAVARPGLADCRAADLLAGALAESGLDPGDPGRSVGRAAWAGRSGFAGRTGEGAGWARRRSRPPDGRAIGRARSTR